MNKYKKIIHSCFILLLLTIVFIPGISYAANDVIRLGSAITISKTQNVGDVVAIGGPVTIEGQTDTVVVIGGNLNSVGGMTDDVVVVGGNAIIDSTVNGDIAVVGGQVQLLENAIVNGDIITFSSNLIKHENAIITGNTVHKNTTDISQYLGFDLYTLRQYAPEFFMGFWLWVSISGGLLMIAFGWLLAILFPRNTKSVAGTIEAEALKSFGIGLLIKVLSIPVAIALAITILGIPLIFVMFLALWIAQYLGLASLGYMISQKLSNRLDMSMGFGVMVFVGLLIIALVKAIPFAGTIIDFILKSIALGAVLLSRFGTERTNPATDIDADDLNRY